MLNIMLATLALSTQSWRIERYKTKRAGVSFTHLVMYNRDAGNRGAERRDVWMRLHGSGPLDTAKAIATFIQSVHWIHERGQLDAIFSFVTTESTRMQLDAIGGGINVAGSRRRAVLRGVIGLAAGVAVARPAQALPAECLNGAMEQRQALGLDPFAPPCNDLDPCASLEATNHSTPIDPSPSRRRPFTDYLC